MLNNNGMNDLPLTTTWFTGGSLYLIGVNYKQGITDLSVCRFFKKVSIKIKCGLFK